LTAGQNYRVKKDYPQNDERHETDCHRWRTENCTSKRPFVTQRAYQCNSDLLS